MRLSDPLAISYMTEFQNILAMILSDSVNKYIYFNANLET